MHKHQPAHTTAPTVIQKILVKGYNMAQMTLDPVAHVESVKKRVASELDARHEFFVVPDLSKPHKDGADNHDFLTDEERERAFGKTRLLKPDDVTWHKLNAALLPSRRAGAVGRVNGAMHGSHNNARFSMMHHSMHIHQAGHTEVKYSPRTVSIYDKKEDAILAAKILRILTKNDTGHHSVASILAEAIDNGSGEPVWVVSDNMNMQTHNALRMYFRNLAQDMTQEQRDAAKHLTQAEVNSRLKPGEHWEAQEGVPTLLTLHGRPGIKMYKKLPNGKDDPHDIKVLDRIREQELPRIVKGVPHQMVMASDGREYFEDDSLISSVGLVLVGPKGCALIRSKGKDTRLIGELVKKEAEFILKPTEATNAFALSHDITEGIRTAVTTIADKPLTLGIGAATVVAHGAAIIAGTSFYSLFKKMSGKDPMRNSVKQWVEAKCGPLEETKLFKVWEPREHLPGVTLTAREADTMDSCPTLDTIRTPLGKVNLSAKAQLAFKNDYATLVRRQRAETDKAPQSFGHGFKNFMRHHHRWPSVSELETENPVTRKFFKDHPEFFVDRDKLTIAFGNWMQRACRGHDEPVAEALAEAVTNFSEMLRKVHGLSSEATDRLWEATRDCLTSGINAYLEEGVDQQAAAAAAPAASKAL